MGYTIIATSKEIANEMNDNANEYGIQVDGTKIWRGPVPNGSYEYVTPYVRMSTPEYFFLRMANELPFLKAVQMGMELCGKYTTNLTRPDLDEDEYEFIKECRTTKKRIESYLYEIRFTKEGKRALKVLDHIVERSCSPMSTYLYMLMCMPQKFGGAGMEKPYVSASYTTLDGFMPDQNGAYIAYDLYWHDERVAVQFVGDEYPKRTERTALEKNGTTVIYADSERMTIPLYSVELVSSAIYRLTGEIVNVFDLARMMKPFFNDMQRPMYDNMELTFADIMQHM